MKGIKFTIFNYSPYEYKFLEKYLEDMALKGWKLKSITGAFLKFNKIEPSKIKYSVDVMDGISFFDGKNSSESLEYREYCKAAGWNFVCEKEKIQVYCSEDDIERIPIHTDEEEKFKCIFKASLKYNFLSLFTAIMLLAIQYMVVNGVTATFLASNFSLITILMAIIFAVQEIVGIINFIVWAVKGKKQLNRNREVSYNSFYGIKLKRLMYNGVVILSLILLISMSIQGEGTVINMIVVNLIIVLAMYLIINFVSKTKYRTKKKRKINIAAYVAIIILGFISMNIVIFRGPFINGNNYESRVSGSNIKLTLEDFNDVRVYENEPYIHEEKGVIASNLFYSDTGENISISYELFESKYEFIINYYYSRLIERYKEWDIQYAEINTELPSDVKVYIDKDFKKYLFLAKDKVLEFTDYDDTIAENEIINRVYENIFK